MVYIERFRVRIRSQTFSDVTVRVEEIVSKSKIKKGVCLVFTVGSTSGLILNEHEPMLLQDILDTLELVSDSSKIYNHTENAFSHIRSSLVGNNQMIPVEDGKLVRGTWQDIMILNFDTREREREVVVTVMGE